MSAPARLAAVAAALLLPRATPAQPRLADLPAAVAVQGGRLMAQIDLAPAFDAPLLRRLGNGLTNVVAVVLAVVPLDGGPPLTATARVSEVLYDVWEESYTVTVRDRSRPGLRRLSAGDPAGLGRVLAGGEPFELGPVAALPPGGFRLEARLEVNPVSRELMQRTRELLANPEVGGRPGAGSRSVIGAVASYLLRDPGPGDDLVVLRSRRLDRPEVTAP